MSFGWVVIVFKIIMKGWGPSLALLTPTFYMLLLTIHIISLFFDTLGLDQVPQISIFVFLCLYPQWYVWVPEQCFNFSSGANWETPFPPFFKSHNHWPLCHWGGFLFTRFCRQPISSVSTLHHCIWLRNYPKGWILQQFSHLLGVLEIHGSPLFFSKAFKFIFPASLFVILTFRFPDELSPISQ